MAESEEHGSILEDSDMILERREEQEHSEDFVSLVWVANTNRQT